jgi:hypothetical protein
LCARRRFSAPLPHPLFGHEAGLQSSPFLFSELGAEEFHEPSALGCIVSESVAKRAARIEWFEANKTKADVELGAYWLEGRDSRGS